MFKRSMFVYRTWFRKKMVSVITTDENQYEGSNPKLR